MSDKKDNKLNTKKKRPASSVLYYITSLEFSKLNCKQLILSLMHRRLYETHHYIPDTVLLQDSQHCCNENHLAAIIGLNNMTFNVLTFARQKISANTPHRNKETAARAPLMSYNHVITHLRGNPLIALNYLRNYLNTLPS
ncbi:MAG: hypothetical protein ACI4VX_07850 [Succinivibrionaceae bacterium]